MLSSQAQAVPMRMGPGAAVLPRGAGAWHGASAGSRHPTGSIPSSGELCQAPPFICPCIPPTLWVCRCSPHPGLTKPAPSQAVPASCTAQIRMFPALLQVGHPSTCLAPMRIRHQLLPESCSGHRKISVPADPQRVQPCVLRARIIWRLLCNERMMNVSISRTREAMEISGG